MNLSHRIIKDTMLYSIREKVAHPDADDMEGY